ncbi:hypothetical protein BU14_0098s0059 [Porphyra umbilicalis]|uniref:EamA domain-containing protein n=1 Tax=Porphyra umbilicalis TaxID=2786 RepID=A0A1X6PDY0_PORUM|nr:hypothetical protein BU14_0098s0059 [Porphyra umbilicalis]|eukprot:OSX78833.1 hypothetical protein BU14_0098s0059 [Porphyra umbilicalis]
MTRTTAIAGLLTFGTLCSLFAKLIYYAEGASRYGGIAKFEKPWFQVLAMFIGMSFCILLDLPKRKRNGPAVTDGETEPLKGGAVSSVNGSGAGSSAPVDAPEPSVPWTESVWVINVPTLFDLFATACGTTGLLYTTVSVYQMLRGAQLIFAALLSIIFLGRRLDKFNWVGIGLAISGIALVGAANIMGESSVTSKADIKFGVIIIIAGQVLQASQVVLEEYLLQNLKMTSIRVVAWEGLFGVMHCVLWVLPLAYFLPGRDHGRLEESVDSVYMCAHSWKVALVLLGDMTAMLAYNVCGMQVTQSLSAVHRVILETLRTLCVWIIDLFLFYFVTNGGFGERWTSYSLLQALGFVLLVTGTLTYNATQLMAEFHSRRRVRAEAPGVVETAVVGAVEAVVAYGGAAAPVPAEGTSAGSPALGLGVSPSSRPIGLPGAIEGEDEDEDECASDDEDETGVRASSYMSHPFGSAAHSPYLAMASTPRNSSMSASLRMRAAAQRHARDQV